METTNLTDLSTIDDSAVDLAFMKEIEPAGLKCIPVLGTKLRDRKVGRRNKKVEVPCLFYHMFNADDSNLYDRAKFFISQLKEEEKLVLTYDILEERVAEIGKNEFVVVFREGTHENHPLDAIAKLHGNPIMIEVTRVQ